MGSAFSSLTDSRLLRYNMQRYWKRWSFPDRGGFEMERTAERSDRKDGG